MNKDAIEQAARIIQSTAELLENRQEDLTPEAQYGLSNMLTEQAQKIMDEINSKSSVLPKDDEETG